MHYTLITGLYKSVRGSDPDAAIYWLARMLEGGEDPSYICRRLVRIAAEDIGLADLHASSICIEAWQSFERLGSPEGDLSLARAVCYLALAPKSNAVYTAFSTARQLAKKTGSIPPPTHILNAPTELMKNNGYGHYLSRTKPAPTDLSTPVHRHWTYGLVGKLHRLKK